MMQNENESRPKDDAAGGLQLSGVQITFAMITAFGLILAINFSSRIAAGQPLQEARREVQAEVQQLEEEQATLTALRDYSQSDAYVENWARSQGKMVRSGETLVVPVPAGVAVAEPTAVPMPVVPFQDGAPQLENWEVWWNLFFDAPPPN